MSKKAFDKIAAGLNEALERARAIAMIKCEIIQDKAVLLDHTGRVWQVELGLDGQPTMLLLETVPRDTMKHLMAPRLARYMA